jgi:hypothetical protein
MKDSIRDNKWLFVYIILNIICVIYGTLYAQSQNDWDATEILSEMDKSWSIGNGCSEGHHKVVNVYGILELNGNTLEIMDSTIQIIDGWITNFGVDIDITNHPLIVYRCENSAILEFPPTLSD